MLPSVQALMFALRQKSETHYTHSLRVSYVSVALARALHLDGDSVDDARCAALLHDIGKLAIRDSILNKPDTLNERDMEIMREHPLHGYKALMEVADLSKYAPYALQHHERPDGTGYPGNLPLESIHMISRILNIADRYSAMTEDRSYRKAHAAPEMVIASLELDTMRFFGKDKGKLIIETLHMFKRSSHIEALPDSSNEIVRLFHTAAV